ncbi:acyl-CoA thioesterase II [uncultured Mycolicibacterium sp.]|uniref:acyl-CoA thioesterase n=1 Tax=uncultured Mycolicibacterium sp. TaxID=2320817 RepID=UPI00262A2DD0|nr:acyl-CoA thioesterase domain-containing protein [uncultured Mycolicibacterium sp.]
MPQLTELLDSLDVRQVGDLDFVAHQLDDPTHHIAGGHIAAQALVAGGRTAPGRVPHSFHAYFLRAGDARYPVDMHVTGLRDGGTLSTRRVTAVQRGEVLLEAHVSFSAALETMEYHQPMPEVPAPEALPPVHEQLACYADEFNGLWIRERPVERRYIDPPPRLAMDLPEAPPRIRMWWRPVDSVPDDPVLNAALLTYHSGVSMLETALVARRTSAAHTFNALIDHAVWFHRPADLNDWVLADAVSPSGVAGRGLATGVMYNRGGDLICTATQELYFGRDRR